MSAASELYSTWKRGSVRLNVGATSDQFAQLGHVFGCALPEEFLELYRLADGMPDHDHDDRFVSFWSIRRMLAEPQRTSEMVVPFADVLLDSWRFLLRPLEGQLRVLSQNVPPGAPMRVVGTFGAFLQDYLTRPNELNVLAV